MPDLPRIVVAGDVIDDIVVVPAGPIRRDTDTPSSIARRAGGSAANTAAWLGSLGTSVDFVGIVGAGDVRRHALMLERHGVRAHLASSELNTGTIVVIVEGEQRAMLTERGANAVFDPATVTDELLAGAAVLLLTGHSLQGAGSSAPIAELIARATAAGVTVAVSPGSAGHIVDAGIDVFERTFAGASMLFPSADEARALAGIENTDAAASALSRRTPLVVLTDGGNGILVAAGPSLERVPVQRVDVVDPTGAGDAFTAGFFAEWVQSRDPIASARSGAVVAARSLAIIGGRPI